MAWVQVALLGLEIVKWILDRATAAGQFDAGKQSAVLEASLAIAKRTEQGKAILEKIDAMAPGERDDLDDALGADNGAGGKG